MFKLTFMLISHTDIDMKAGTLISTNFIPARREGAMLLITRHTCMKLDLAYIKTIYK